MEFSQERHNYIKISCIILDIIPMHLRRLFIEKWNEKNPNKEWNSDASSGNDLYNKLSVGFRNNKTKKIFIDKIVTGKETEWDTTTLVQILLESGLNLIQKCRSKGERSNPLRTSEEIDHIRGIRNGFFSHLPSMAYTSQDFEDVVTNIKSTAKGLFGEDVVREIEEIENSTIEEDINERSKELVKQELDCLRDMKNNLQQMQDNVEKLGIDFKELMDEMKEIKRLLRNAGANQPEPITQEVTDKVKDKYKALYAKHEIHTVDQNKCIVMKEESVNEFAVKLTITRDVIPKDTFKDEKRRYFDSLRLLKSDNIEIGNLLDKGNKFRVTFIRGIAGMGKTVLAKQLAYGWADGTMYDNFKMCIMIECRQLNYFQATEGAELQQYKVFDEFLNERFNYDLGDGDGILFVVDGLDELYDINLKDSIIGQLLDLSHSKYSRSKIIITGRPHVEKNLTRHGNQMGGLQTFEIQGLSDKQIEDYIGKFSSLAENILNINKAKELSQWNLPIIYIPQFLNTFCCVAILTQGKRITDSTELYCWTVYLLLKQHDAGKSDGSKLELISEIFKEYSNLLLTLSSVCYDLLNKNQIIFEGKIESLLLDSNTGDSTARDSITGKKFIKGLFFQVPSNFEERYQFKHLSLMEFLAALHICWNIKDYKKIFKKNLEQGFIEVVSFVCRLNAGFSSEGIIKTILQNVTEFEPIDAKVFLKNVFKIITESEVDERTKFKSSIQIVAYFLSTDFKGKDFLISLLQKLNYRGFSDVIDSNNMMHICNYLKEVCKCDINEVSMALENIWFVTSEVQHLDNLVFVQYVKNVERIKLRGISKDWKSIRFLLNNEAVGRCRKVYIEDCRIEDEEVLDKGRRGILEQKFEVLAIERCILNAISFNSICEFGMSCGVLSLSNLEIREEWWEDLVTLIKERKTNNDLVLKIIMIMECKINLTEEMKMEILQCDVTLQIDGKTLDPETFLPDSPDDDESSSDGNDENEEFEDSTSPKEDRDISDNEDSNTAPSSLIVSTVQPQITSDDKRKENIKSIHIIDDYSKMPVKMIADRNRRVLYCDSLHLSLEVQRNSINMEVKLEIKTIDISEAPPIPCDFGEVILSDVIQVNPMGILFKRPAILSIYHSIVELPELSSIGVKCYDFEIKEWIALPLHDGHLKQQTTMVAADISVTSLFVACISLDLRIYSVPKAGSSISPFDSKHSVKLIFEENTFNDDNSMLKLKMNVFSEKAIFELSQFGLKPFPVLHIKEVKNILPLKPVTLQVLLNEELQSDEKVIVLCGDSDELRIQSGFTSFEVGRYFIRFPLKHCPLVSVLIQKKSKPMDPQMIVGLLRKYSGPRYHVNFGTYCSNLLDAKKAIQIGCCEEHKLDELRNYMAVRQCEQINLFQTELYGNTGVNIKLVGRHCFVNQPRTLTFLNTKCNYLNELEVSADEERLEESKLVISKTGNEIPQIIPFIFPPEVVHPSSFVPEPSNIDQIHIVHPSRSTPVSMEAANVDTESPSVITSNDSSSISDQVEEIHLDEP